MPAKAVGAAKKTPSRRTTQPKSNVVDFDAERRKAKRGKTKPKFQIHAYGRDWNLQRPNAVLTGELLESESLTSMVDYMLAHIIDDEREAFLEALRSDNDLDEDDIALLTGQLTSVVYADIPTAPS